MEKVAHPTGGLQSCNNKDLERRTPAFGPTDFCGIQKPLANQKTGFALLESRMALGYAQRADGWPVGPELIRYRAWSCTSPTVQLVELRRRERGRRFVVLTLFPFLRTDRRHPPSPPMTLHRARRFAFARLRALAPDGQLAFGRGGGIELCRGGDHIGLEVML
ncbi:hypothetical protein [Sphingomonas metalli]|uniref:hypothetical protein n=1 Tax=Sphingomonas metalli TaxID=1779358 RepID=UPI0016644311|nr:hypothetical protein [Sphingomonas metalli]